MNKFDQLLKMISVLFEDRKIDVHEYIELQRLATETRIEAVNDICDKWQASNGIDEQKGAA